VKRVTLYIGHCSGSGCKYFGKTTLHHSKEELQENYWGSGPDWIKHYHQFGDPQMEVYWTGPESEVEEIALEFSRRNNIVSSPMWLNKIVENGLGGGWDHCTTPDVREKASKTYSKTVQKIEANGKTIAQNRSDTAAKTSTNTICENGKTIAENGAITSAITMSKEDENGETIRQRASKKMSDTINDTSKGESIAQKRGNKISKTRIKNNKSKGSKNPAARKISVFYLNNYLERIKIFTSCGNFKTCCFIYNIPFREAGKALREGRPMYNTKQSKHKKESGYLVEYT